MNSRTKIGLYAYRFLSDLTPIYALYPLLFQSRGIPDAWISVLFMVLAFSTLFLEVPTGLFADRVDRRIVLVLSGMSKAFGFLLWLVWPNPVGFTLGLMAWGLGTSLESGCWQAFIYDELAAQQKTGEFRSLLGRLLGTSFIATLVSSLMGFVIFQYTHNYSMILAVSICALIGAGCVAFTFPKARVREKTTPSTLRQHIAEAVGIWNRVVHVRWIIISAALLGGIKGSLDEYHGLLLSEKGIPTAAVPLFYAGFTLMGAIVFFFLAQNRRPAKAVRLIWLVAGVGFLIGSVMWLPTPFAICALILMNFFDSVFRLDNEALLQSTIDSDATRATITSVSSFSQQLVALLVFGASALLLNKFPFTALYLVGGGVLLATALFEWRNARRQK